MPMINLSQKNWFINKKKKKMIINNTYLEDVESQLYPGCSKYTKLSSVAILFKHKVLHVLSNKGFIEIL